MQIFIPIFLRVTDESIFLSEDLGVKKEWKEKSFLSCRLVNPQSLSSRKSDKKTEKSQIQKISTVFFYRNFVKARRKSKDIADPLSREIINML